MSLQLILGGSGSGKSTYLYERVIEGSLKDPSQMYIIIVPEQYTMATQRLLVSLHPRHALMNIEILSFERLALRIFDELGTDMHTMLGETGKSLVLSHIAGELADDLPVLGSKLRRPGFINEMKSLISELSLYHISPEELLESVTEAGSSRSTIEKVTDISRVYRAFLDRIDGSFITAEQVLELLIPIVEDSGFVRGSVMVFDGFTGFTPLQNELMLIFLRIADSVRVSLCVDSDADVLSGYEEDELFAITKRTAMSLVRMARSVNCEILPEVRLAMDEHSRFPKQNAISHIESAIFRRRLSVYEKKAGEVTVTRCQDPRRELMYAAATIHRLVRTEGLRYSQIAVCSYDLSRYSPYTDEVFDAFSIPCFVDEKTKITFNPCFEFLTAALEMEVTDYNADSIMHFLRSGPWIMEESDKDLMDRYLAATGIRGAACFSKPFTIQPGHIGDDELVRLNEIREALWAKVGPYHDVLGSAKFTVEAATRAIYDLMCAYEIEDILTGMYELATEEGDEKKAREYERIYRITVDLFDQFIDLLGDSEVTAEEYSKLFASGIDNAKVGRIPATNDSVIVGDIERTRLDGIHTLIMLGANDGIIPKSVQRGGLLSQSERLKLSDKGVEMAPSDREQTFMQRFYLYLAMTKPSERLYITYSEVDSDGTAMRPSYIINMLDRMLPEHGNGSYEDETLWAESVYSSKRVLSDALRELSYGHDEDVSKNAGIISYFDKHDRKTLGRLLEAADYHYDPDPISQTVMRAIDGGVIRGSVSRMESYASCAERYFLQYILKLFEPPEVGLEVVDMGTLYHDALYLYEKAVKKSGKDLGSISAEESEKLLNEAITEAFGRIKKPHILSSARQSYILKRMEKTLKRTVWALGRQVAAGDYVPEGFEISLGELSGREHIEVPLDDRLILSLSGRIDRFDLMKKERSRYLKVIDYKSSSKKISYPRVYYGLQLQLLYYMSNLMRYEKERHPDDEIIPAAAFYYALLDPEVDAGWDMTDEQFDEQILKALKPEGMLSNNRDAVVGMDRLLGAVGKGDPGVASSVIPAKINKDGEKFADKPKLTSKDDFIDLCGYVEKKIAAIGRDIASGKMIASPYREGDENACKYCPYNSVCGFDRDIKGYEYRDIKGLSDDEALQRMREE